MRGATIAEVAARGRCRRRHGVARPQRFAGGQRERTRRRVLEAIADARLRSRTPRPARSPPAARVDRRHRAVLHPPSVIERLRGVSRVLAAAGYQLMLFDVERAEQARRVLPPALRGADRRPAVDLARAVGRRPRRLAAAGCPWCWSTARTSACPAFTSTTSRAAGMATEHLLELGHRRIAFIGDMEENHYGFDSSAHAARRLSGGARATPGCPLAPELVRRARTAARPRAVLARELLARADPPTAIFAASDVQAIGVLEAARAAGVSVPDDLSVIGFDDVEIARYTGLTTDRAAARGERRDRRRTAAARPVRRGRRRLGSCRLGSSCGARLRRFGTDGDGPRGSTKEARVESGLTDGRRGTLCDRSVCRAAAARRLPARGSSPRAATTSGGGGGGGAPVETGAT